MNREQAKQLLPIIQAFADVETLQFRAGWGGWADITDASFAEPSEYRIKPKLLERWLVVDRDGNTTTHPTENDARNAMSARLGIREPYRIVHLREVTE